MNGMILNLQMKSKILCYLFLSAQAPIIIDKERLIVGDVALLQSILKEKFPEKGYKVMEKRYC